MNSNNQNHIEDTGIHPAAIVSPNAKIGNRVTIRPFTLIEDGVVIGDDCTILRGATLRKNTILGNKNLIGENAIIGSEPQDASFAYQDIPSGVKIGDGNVIKENVTIHRSAKSGEYTSIGNHNFLMTNVHIAHDCQLKDHIIMVNNATIAGHVQIDNHTFISANCLIHQFVRIGRNVMISAMSRVVADIPPFLLVEGYLGRYRGLNITGLRRNSFTSEDRNLIKTIYMHFFNYNFSEGIEKIKQMPSSPLRDEILEFITFPNKRGFIRKE